MKSLKTSCQLDIISRVRVIREKNRVSHGQLAEFLGISNGLVGNIESPKFPHKYTLSQLYKICKRFDIPFAQLFMVDCSEDMIDVLIEKLIEYDE